jgi:hypothetical protein
MARRGYEFFGAHRALPAQISSVGGNDLPCGQPHRQNSYPPKLAEICFSQATLEVVLPPCPYLLYRAAAAPSFKQLRDERARSLALSFARNVLVCTFLASFLGQIKGLRPFTPRQKALF